MRIKNWLESEKCLASTKYNEIKIKHKNKLFKIIFLNTFKVAPFLLLFGSTFLKQTLRVYSQHSNWVSFFLGKRFWRHGAPVDGRCLRGEEMQHYHYCLSTWGFSGLHFRPPASFLLAYHNRSSGLPGLPLPIFAKHLVGMLRRRMGRVSPWGFPQQPLN